MEDVMSADDGNIKKLRATNLAKRRRKRQLVSIWGALASICSMTCLLSGANMESGDTKIMVLLVTGAMTLVAMAIMAVMMQSSGGLTDEEIKGNAIPDGWNDGFKETALFMDGLIALPDKGLMEHDRPRMQHLADCYARDLCTLLGTEKPWRIIEKYAIDMKVRSIHLDDQQDDLERQTQAFRGMIARGIDWQSNRGFMMEHMIYCYPHVINMARNFGLDMNGVTRPEPTPLPGQVGGIAVEAPIPEQLRTLAGQYRATDRRMLRDEDRIEGDAVVDRDIPMLSEAWHKARITSESAMHDAIDFEYAETARTMCVTLSGILVRVSQDARGALESTGRYIIAKHDPIEPFVDARMTDKAIGADL